MGIKHIQVVAEAAHSLTFEFFQGSTPFDVTGRVYVMKIVDDVDTPTVTVTFTPTVTANEVELIGDCSVLTHADVYEYQLVEDGNAILQGTVDVLPRFA